MNTHGNCTRCQSVKVQIQQADFKFRRGHRRDRDQAKGSHDRFLANQRKAVLHSPVRFVERGIDHQDPLVGGDHGCMGISKIVDGDWMLSDHGKGVYYKTDFTRK